MAQFEDLMFNQPASNPQQHPLQQSQHVHHPAQFISTNKQKKQQGTLQWTNIAMEISPNFDGIWYVPEK